MNRLGDRIAKRREPKEQTGTVDVVVVFHSHHESTQEN